jgi:hypothetical protein
MARGPGPASDAAPTRGSRPSPGWPRSEPAATASSTPGPPARRGWPRRAGRPTSPRAASTRAPAFGSTTRRSAAAARNRPPRPADDARPLPMDFAAARGVGSLAEAVMAPTRDGRRESKRASFRAGGSQGWPTGPTATCRRRRPRRQTPRWPTPRPSGRVGGREPRPRRAGRTGRRPCWVAGRGGSGGRRAAGTAGLLPGRPAHRLDGRRVARRASRRRARLPGAGPAVAAGRACRTTPGRPLGGADADGPAVARRADRRSRRAGRPGGPSRSAAVGPLERRRGGAGAGQEDGSGIEVPCLGRRPHRWGWRLRSSRPRTTEWADLWSRAAWMSGTAGPIARGILDDIPRRPGIEDVPGGRAADARQGGGKGPAGRFGLPAPADAVVGLPGLLARPRAAEAAARSSPGPPGSSRAGRRPTRRPATAGECSRAMRDLRPLLLWCKITEQYA